MAPRSFCCGALIVSGAVAWFAAGAPAPPAKSEVSPAAALNRRADFGGFDDPKITLQEALDKLADLYGVPLEVNEKAFKFENVPDVLKAEVATTPVLPMKNARLDTVLDRVLKRITVGSGPAYLVRREGIEITTGQFRNAEVWGTHSGPFLPLVHRKFDKVPLDEALKELSDLTEFTIVLDGRTAERGKTAVTASFLNTPLDTAVQFLADMADLRSLQRDNLLYVTSKDNATAWQNRFQKERKLSEEGDASIVGGSSRLGSGRQMITVVNPPIS
jgi:hypothetical protein